MKKEDNVNFQPKESMLHPQLIENDQTRIADCKQRERRETISTVYIGVKVERTHQVGSIIA